MEKFQLDRKWRRLAIDTSADTTQIDKNGFAFRKASQIIQSEIDIYDYYIQGEVYGYCLEEGHTVEHKDLVTGAIWTSTEYETVDSCYGFYGDCSSDILHAALGDEWEIIEEIKEDK